MAPLNLVKTAGSIAALAVSYTAAFWLFSLPVHYFAMLSRFGWMGALFCTLGVGSYFWAVLLAHVAKNGQWSQRGCQFVALTTMVPGVLFLFTLNLPLRNALFLFYQASFTGFILTKMLYPNFYRLGPFERDRPAGLFPE